jgi:hypothetical protein
MNGESKRASRDAKPPRRSGTTLLDHLPPSGQPWQLATYACNGVVITFAATPDHPPRAYRNGQRVNLF